MSHAGSFVAVYAFSSGGVQAAIRGSSLVGVLGLLIAVASRC